MLHMPAGMLTALLLIGQVSDLTTWLDVCIFSVFFI